MVQAGATDRYDLRLFSKIYVSATYLTTGVVFLYLQLGTPYAPV